MYLKLDGKNRVKGAKKRRKGGFIELVVSSWQLVVGSLQ